MKAKMAKAKFISEFERDVIRIGHFQGTKAPAIGRFLNRSKQAIYNEIKAMTDAGTIDNRPMCFVCKEIGAAMDAEAAKNADW